MDTCKVLIAAALALTGSLGTSVAQAGGRDDIQWSVTIGAPAHRGPVYVQPAPAFVQPVAPAYVQPAPAYMQPAPVYPYHDHHRSPRWDRDGDGIPNRYDRVYNPRWDRDGDGVPNRYDRYNNLRHDRDGDGIPNWHDRNDRYGRRW